MSYKHLNTIVHTYFAPTKHDSFCSRNGTIEIAKPKVREIILTWHCFQEKGILLRVAFKVVLDETIQLGNFSVIRHEGWQSWNCFVIISHMS